MSAPRPAGTERLDTILQRARTITIVAHTNPDGDAIGSCVAMLHYLIDLRGKNAAVILPDAEPHTLSFMVPDIDRPVFLAYPAARADAEGRIAASDLIICQDCNGFARTAAMEPALRASGAVKVLIDHHLDPDRKAFDLVFSEPRTSSACELLYWILMEMPDIRDDARRLPRESAAALLTGMTTDTNNFANSTWPSTFSMASALIEAGVDRDAILQHLYNDYRENRLRLMGHFLRRMRITRKGVAYMVLERSVQRQYDMQDGETEGFVNLPLTAGRVRMSIFLKEDEGYFRVSIRSRKGISAQQCAERYFHGGGHEQAAGGKLYFPGDIRSREEAAAYVVRVTNRFLP